MEDSKSLIDYMMEDAGPPSRLRVFKWKLRVIVDFLYEIKYLFQKIFRKHHTSDKDIWDLSNHIANIVLKKLLAFKEYPRRGYPAGFAEYFENEWPSREEYDKAVADGEIVGGGAEAWEKALDEMIFAFDFILNYDGLEYKGKTKKVLDRWNLKFPHTKTDDNKRISYIYRIKDGGYLMSSSKPPEEHEEAEFLGEDINYYNFELEKEYYNRAHKGLELFGKYFMQLCD